MTYSMTAFARHEFQGATGTFTWELRSVNHRYLEPNLRLPDPLRHLEPEIRKTLQQKLKRGKVDCTLKFQPPADQITAIEINHPLLEQLAEAMNQVQSSMAAEAAAATPLELLSWPGVVNPPPAADSETQATEAISSLKQALDQLNQTRQREGNQLIELIDQRLQTIGELVGRIETKMPEILVQRGEKLRSRIADAVEKIDADRLEQELVLIAQKADVEEELDRLRIHLREVRDTINRQEPIGRRLDFLMQELNREANTTASKSIDGEMTAITVDIKVLIEQMREQIQNIE